MNSMHRDSRVGHCQLVSGKESTSAHLAGRDAPVPALWSRNGVHNESERAFTFPRNLHEWEQVREKGPNGWVLRSGAPPWSGLRHRQGAALAQDQMVA